MPFHYPFVLKTAIGTLIISVLSLSLFEPAEFIHTTLFILTSLTSVLFGAVATFTLKICMSERQASHPQMPRKVTHIQTHIIENIVNSKSTKIKGADQIHKGQVDLLCEEIASLCVNDFLLTNLELDENSKNKLRGIAEGEFNVIIEEIKKRFNSINHVQFLAKVVLEKLTKHLEKYKRLNEDISYFTLSHLRTIESEKNYLNRLSGVLAIHLLPDSYKIDNLIMFLIRDILTNHVLFPFIEKISQPVFINEKVISTIKKYKIDSQYETFISWETFENFASKSDSQLKEDFSLQKIKSYCINLIGKIM